MEKIMNLTDAILITALVLALVIGAYVLKRLYNKLTAHIASWLQEQPDPGLCEAMEEEAGNIEVAEDDS
jgi:hypothetical protein